MHTHTHTHTHTNTPHTHIHAHVWQERPLNFFLDLFFLNHPGFHGEFSFGFDGIGIDPETRQRYSRVKIAKKMCHSAMRCGMNMKSGKKTRKDKIIDKTEKRKGVLDIEITKSKQVIRQMNAEDTEEVGGKKVDPKKKAETLVHEQEKMAEAQKELTCMRKQLQVHDKLTDRYICED